ncbi:hypothetical protein K4G95_23890, partial [Mycobacterium tuberculosis]|nr:hypothetical protein [Mycobacterium tuberculosis]
GVCILRALSVDQLLGEPFSRFFQDLPAWLEPPSKQDADPTQPRAGVTPDAQLVAGISAGDSREVVSVRLTVTPTRFDGLPAQQ